MYAYMFACMMSLYPSLYLPLVVWGVPRAKVVFRRRHPGLHMLRIRENVDDYKTCWARITAIPIG